MASAAPGLVAEAALDPGSDGLVLESRTRWSARRLDRDRWVLLGAGGGFLAAATLAAAVMQTGRQPSAWVYGLFVVLYALASRVQFEVGTGAAVPTELVLVPMLFVLPLPAVPFCVAAGLCLGHLRGSALVDRGLVLLLSSWHVLGPVAVLGIATDAFDRAPDWSDWPLYAAALAAQFLVDFTTSAAREWIGLGVPPGSRVSFMGWVYLVDATLAPIGLLVAFAASTHPVVIVLALPLVGLLSLFARERGQRIDAALELGHAYRGTALLLGDVVEADDAYTGEHSRDVVSLTLAVADRLRLDARSRRNAEFVALLHDVGKIRIPAEIINKPGPLDADERAVIETHTVEGEAMLTRVGGLLGEVGRNVRSCHERWDGAGYPDGLAGERIPLIARIVCAADAYSAMTTDRPYRQARSPQEAVAELRRCAGTHFDPRVVAALADAVA